jgi:dephospho-CoA kinase
MPTLKKVKKKIVIGLTGGIGSGKSAVLAEFKRLGAVTADADQIARRVVRRDGPAYGAVVRLLGRDVVRDDHELDRAAVAARVFSRPPLRRALEKIIHPFVRREMTDLVAATPAGVVVLDIPLLFESGWTDLVDMTIVVWAPEKTRLARLTADGRFARADVRRRLRAQMPLIQKRRLADVVIDNGGTPARTRAQVRRILSLAN